MKRYEFIRKQEGLNLLLEGTTQEDLFRAGLEGISEIISPESCEKNNSYPMEMTRYLSIFSDEIAPLLINFLSSVLELSLSNKVVFCKVDFIVLENNLLKAQVRGFRADEIMQEIKEITHRKAEVTRNKAGNLEAVLVFKK